MSSVDPSSVLVADLEVLVDVALAAVEAAKRRGSAVVVDPAPPERVADHLLSASDHLTPDHWEATALTGVDASRSGGALAAAEDLNRRGAATVYVKLPAGGCAIASSGVRAVVRGPEGLDVVDATGAGDAFAGGLAWALHSGWDVVGAAVLAVAASSCAVEAYGSQASYPIPSQLPAMAGLRALVADVRAGGVEQGGSTITQQVLKNAFTGSERTLGRKLREAVLARRLERALEDEIQFRHLSTVYFGNGAYGVGAASSVYFRKQVSDLTLSEVAPLRPPGQSGAGRAQAETHSWSRRSAWPPWDGWPGAWG